MVGLPIAITRHVDKARDSAGRQFQIYGTLPSYRAMLDREGAAGAGDVAIVGDESAVGAALDRLRDAGTTVFLGIPFAVEGDADAFERTRGFLAGQARRAG